MKIGSITLSPPFALAPMAGMTDTAFRRLVKRKGGCGLVVTEMVSSEGLVRGIDRTLEYAEYTEEERPVSIQIFGGDPAKMADAAQIVEGMGADIVDVNMGCPVPKIAKHTAGCSLMREPEHGGDVVRAMARAVKIPVTVKMRAGWDASAINAPDLAQADGRRRRGSARGPRPHGRAVVFGRLGLGADRDGRGRRVDSGVRQRRLRGARTGRGAAARRRGRRCARRPRRACGTPGSFSRRRTSRPGARRARFPRSSAGNSCCEYVDLLMTERLGEADGFRHVAPGQSASAGAPVPARGHDRWVINKLRALNSWYTKGLDNGSHLRVAINAADSVAELRAIIEDFFFVDKTEIAEGTEIAEVI